MIRLMRIAVAALLALAPVACDKEGPTERTGEEIDKTLEDAADKVDDAAGEKGPLEKAGEKADEAAHDATDGHDHK